MTQTPKFSTNMQVFPIQYGESRTPTSWVMLYSPHSDTIRVVAAEGSIRNTYAVASLIAIAEDKSAVLDAPARATLTDLAGVATGLSLGFGFYPGAMYTVRALVKDGSNPHTIHAVWRYVESRLGRPSMTRSPHAYESNTRFDWWSQAVTNCANDADFMARYMARLAAERADSHLRRASAMRAFKAHRNGVENVRELVRLLRLEDPDRAAIRDAYDLFPYVAEYANNLASSSWTSRSAAKMVEFIADVACDSPWWDDRHDPVRKLDCGHYADADNDDGVTDTHGGEWCGACLSEGNVRQVDGDYYPEDEVYYWESDDEYHLYPESEEDDEDEDGSSYLDSWRSSTSGLAHDTTFTPSHDGDFTMGIELEVETSYGGDRRDAVDDCAAHFNSRSGRPYAMFKQDGSLSDSCGFEIVTAACRLPEHINMFSKWRPDSNLTSWDAGNCGMHVHIDSRAFSPLAFGKFLMFYNRPENAGFLRGIAGRHPDMDDQAERYAARLERTDDPIRVKSPVDNSSRYRIVNVTNLSYEEMRRLGIKIDRDSKGSYSTVEIRIFRGTLRKARLLAQIEFAHASVAFCRQASWNGLGEGEFLAWLATAPGYPHLTKWFGASRSRNSRFAVAAKDTQAAEV